MSTIREKIDEVFTSSENSKMPVWYRASVVVHLSFAVSENMAETDRTSAAVVVHLSFAVSENLGQRWCDILPVVV